jgi:hypothetical protein
LTDDVNEMFELSKQAGIQLLPEEVNAVMENMNAERE